MTMIRRLACQVGVATLALSILGCAENDAEDMEPRTIVVDIRNAKDLTQTLGTVTLMEDVPMGLVAVFDIDSNDVIPPGPRAIHIHENPSCAIAPTQEGGDPVPAGAAGGHFNPLHVGHGEDDGPHVGDSDAYNYEFDSDGSFSGTVRFSQASFSGETSVFQGGGTSIVIHSGTDDMRSNPAGDAGPRAACGVISAEEQQD
ncbi:superoxide dismutase family protein [Marinimicrobium sp. ABcell2]|uniref:superoxide dismutase family protein n=1 Tax=Marinimicrobium sp. ABcell2 TaxID=3069751 RepID=UPI0027B566D7|nr:superoxide dismutase family protein [Marinimicrobium sp. ABcell2]MDQ2075109.1 superoxide dismutase family protein [Marinimicrobium sp. ABcell2]